jgi:hypothetical protein
MELDVKNIISIIFMIGGTWLVFKIPTSYMQGYVEWVREKHGQFINLSIGFLISLIGVGFVLMLTDPIKYSLIGTICSVITFALIIIVARDNFIFWKTRFKSKNN